MIFITFTTKQKLENVGDVNSRSDKQNTFMIIDILRRGEERKREKEREQSEENVIKQEYK